MKKSIQKFVALMVILHIIGGSGGILFSSHTCTGCGTHEERVLLMAFSSHQQHDCTAETTEGCCGTAADDKMPPATDICCSSVIHTCATHDSGTCCEYNDERVALETLTRDTGNNQPLITAPLTGESTITVPATTQNYYTPADHTPLLPECKVNVLICCFLL